jgi:hypothetical protein
MTMPTTIFFGPDVSRGSETSSPKIYLRVLLYGTAKRGRVIESLFVELTRNESKQTFPVWVYGDAQLVRGSGLMVGENGISTNHHFLTLRDGADYQFGEGTYQLEVFAKLLNVKTPKRLLSQRLEITAEHATQLKRPHTGVYFDWLPKASRYLAHSESREPGFGTEDLGNLMRIIRDDRSKDAFPKSS